jgi:hypothetical protein
MLYSLLYITKMDKIFISSSFPHFSLLACKQTILKPRLCVHQESFEQRGPYEVRKLS